MKHHLLFPLMGGLLIAASCGGTSPDCFCNGEILPICAEECASHDSPEHVGEAASSLTLSAAAFYSIAYAAGYGPADGSYCNNPSASTWCECNVDYTDAAARCNEPTATVVWEFAAPACTVASASLTYQATEGSSGRTVSIRRILRPVATPPMGLAGSCVTSSVASWWRSGPEAWTVPGAKGDGTDRTATGPSRTLTATALHTESFDVTALVQGCPATGACVLAQYADAHVSVYPGAVLEIACGAATICGDGTLEGSEACDDGNTAGGDGCSATCAVETGWTCAGSPSECATTCGDGVKAGAEACDDGNNVSLDGCSEACASEVCVWQ